MKLNSERDDRLQRQLLGTCIVALLVLSSPARACEPAPIQSIFIAVGLLMALGVQSFGALIFQFVLKYRPSVWLMIMAVAYQLVFASMLSVVGYAFYEIAGLPMAMPTLMSLLALESLCLYAALKPVFTPRMHPSVIHIASL